MHSLPLSLKYKLAAEIHKDVLDSIPFFRKTEHKSKLFLSWVGHRLVPRYFAGYQHIYEENEELSSIFFVTSGEIAYVMPMHNNAVYYTVKKGAIIGFEDYPYFLKMNEIPYDHLCIIASNKSAVMRKFSVMTSRKSHVLEFSISDLIQM